MVAKDDPVTCAIYAAKHDLLDKPGWIRFRKIARRQKKLLQMTNQAKLRSYNTIPKYMFGNSVITTLFKDANLMHNMLIGKSVTDILNCVNKTPIDWYCKKQSTVETATYGSVFSSEQNCVEQIIDFCNKLRYLGVPVWNHSYMFRDNKSVVDSATLPHSKLNKRHTILSFHCVREAIASGMIKFYHIPGETTPSDILSRHWSYSSIWNLLNPLYCFGETTQRPCSATTRQWKYFGNRTLQWGVMNIDKYG